MNGPRTRGCSQNGKKDNNGETKPGNNYDCHTFKKAQTVPWPLAERTNERFLWEFPRG